MSDWCGNAKREFVAFTDADCVIDGKRLKNPVKHFDDEMIASTGGLKMMAVRNV